jgi:hypothetical protein
LRSHPEAERSGEGAKNPEGTGFKTFPYAKTSVIFLSASFYEQGVCCTVALPFTLKSILRQKMTYGNSNISPCKDIIFKISSKRNQNPSRYYLSIANLKFQHKPKYHLSNILK